MQILKSTSATHYRTMQLNIAARTFQEMWKWSNNTASHPTAELNAQGYNVNDGMAYGLFSDSSPASNAYFCRFSHVQNSAVCLCKAEFWGYTATITRDGTFYLAKRGGEEIHKLESVHSIPSPSSSPAVSTLPMCGFVKVQQGRGTGGAVDISSWGLTLSDMDALYGIESSCTAYTGDSCTRSYLNYNAVWRKSGSDMTKWAPGNQNFADYIDFEYSGTTYLIGLGAYDGSVAIIKLTGDGGGNVEGYAYSRVVVDYTGSSSSVRKMAGFGAG